MHFGGIKAVDGISMDIPEGKIITLIGANGAGKSTILRSVSGIVKPQGGEILFGGESLIGKTPDAIVNRGITLVPEGRRVFQTLRCLKILRSAHIYARISLITTLNIYIRFSAS